MKKNVLGLFLTAALTGVAQAETVFVTLEKDNALAVVDPISGKLIKTVEIGQRPRGIAISPDENHVMRESVALAQLRDSGFSDITLSHRVEVNALVTATKPCL